MATPLKQPRLRTAVRKTAKWGGAVVTVVLVVMWIGSGWWDFTLRCPAQLFITLTMGVVSVQWHYLKPTWGGIIETMAGTHYFGFSWRPIVETDRSGWLVGIPLWILLLAALLPTAFAWRADSLPRRRARAGQCTACGYDRSGLAAGVACPECGGSG